VVNMTAIAVVEAAQKAQATVDVDALLAAASE
jgi:hypothetical protein